MANQGATGSGICWGLILLTMKVIETEITPFVKHPMHLDMREDSYLSSPYHAKPAYHKHPELQLTLILEGHGKRIIGNEVADFKSGDMVFIGSNVPHVWLSDPVYFEKDSKLKSKVITVYISPAVFQHIFELIEEKDEVKLMVKEAAKGINIYGKTRSVIADKLIKLSSKTGFEKVVGLLQVMSIIARSAEKRLIMGHEASEESGQYPDRLIQVLKFMNDNLQRQITLDEVAEIACMTKPSFCRFFKSRTQKKFSQYLEEIRINEACKLLIETDYPIADVAHLCGYNSDSHFCKVFREHMGKSPFRFRSEVPKHSC